MISSRFRLAAAMCRSAPELGRFLHGGDLSKSSNLISSTMITTRAPLSAIFSSPARRQLFHSNRNTPTPSSGRFESGMHSYTVSKRCNTSRFRDFTSRPKPSEVITTTKLGVSGGVATVTLPLPGLPGLTYVNVPADVSIRDLVKEIMELDKSLSVIDVADSDGNKVAGCTSMADVANRGLLVSLGGRSRIRLVSDTEDQGAEEVPAPEMYLLLKAEIARAGRVTLTRDGLDGLCDKVYRKASLHKEPATVDPMLADGWLNALVEDGLAFTADKGRVVLLNPSGPGVSDEIASALRRDNELIDLKVSRLREKLDVMCMEEKRLQDIKNTLIAKALRNVTLKKGAVLAFMTAQFGTLAYCVYEVYSWDVMEPATYFLMLSYTVGSSLYFSAHNREASFNNLMDEAIRKREAKLKPVHGYSRSGHEALKGDIKRHEDAVKLLTSQRDAHPPMEPSFG